MADKTRSVINPNMIPNPAGFIVERSRQTTNSLVAADKCQPAGLRKTKGSSKRARRDFVPEAFMTFCNGLRKTWNDSDHDGFVSQHEGMTPSFRDGRMIMQYFFKTLRNRGTGSDEKKTFVAKRPEKPQVTVPGAVHLTLPKTLRDEISVPASINGRDLSTGRL